MENTKDKKIEIELADLLEKMDKNGLALTTAYAQGIEAGAAIQQGKPADQREQAV